MSIYICARRTTIIRARYAYQVLTAAGHDVYWRDPYRFPNYDAAFARRQIEARQHFVVLASRSALRRAATVPDDWLRAEIVHALHTARHIIPVTLAEVQDYWQHATQTSLAAYDPIDLSTEAGGWELLLERVAVPVDVEVTPPADLDITAASLEAEAAFEAGFGAWERGLTSQARRAFDDALDHDPDLVAALQMRGVIRHQQRDLAGALADLDRCLALYPHDADVFDYRGHLRLHAGDGAGALADYEAALTLNPDHAGALAGRAEIRAWMGDHDAALADAERALRLDPNQPEAHHSRAVVLQHSGDLEGAIAAYSRALQLEPTYRSAQHNRGLLRLLRQEYAEAEADFMALIERGDLNAVYLRGLARHRQGHFDAALTDYNVAIAHETDQLIVALTERGNLYLERGDFKQAFSDYREALARDPAHRAAVAGMALAFVVGGEAEKAHELWARLIEADPRHRDPTWTAAHYEWRPALALIGLRIS